MGSGISLTKDQVIQIIERDLHLLFNEKQNVRPKYTDDGIEIFYDFADEVDLKNHIVDIHMFRRKEKRLGCK